MVWLILLLASVHADETCADAAGQCEAKEEELVAGDVGEEESEESNEYWSQDDDDLREPLNTFIQSLPGFASDEYYHRAEWIPDWHFSMLNDVHRNAAYRDVLEKYVTPDTVVLDIGSGAGFLALLAARAGAKHVYSVELDATLAGIARRVIQVNGYADKITLLEKHSTAITVGPGGDIPELPNLLVSEIVDTLLLREYILETYVDAVHRLVAPNATIIPKKGQLHALLFQSPELRNQFYLPDTVDGFDMSPMNEAAGESTGRSIRMSVHRWTAMSVQQEVFAGDFHFPEDLLNFTHGKASLKTANFTAFTDGIIDGLMVWMTLWLDDNIYFSGAPALGDVHTEHWNPHAISSRPFRVRRGDTITVAYGYSRADFRGEVVLHNGKIPTYINYPRADE